MQTVSKNPPPKNHADQTLPNLIIPNQLSRGLDLGESLALLEAALLLEAHNLEAVEVGEGLAALLLELLLGPVALLPLGIDASGLPGLLDGTSAGTTGKLLDDEGGEKGLGEGNDAAGGSELGVGRGAIDKDLCIAKNDRLVSCPRVLNSNRWFPCSVQTYALVVDDLDDGREAAALELEDTANLNEAPGAGTDLDIRHFSCRSELDLLGQRQVGNQGKSADCRKFQERSQKRRVIS